MFTKNLNVLVISPNFNHACGVSRHVFNLVKALTEIKIRVYFITNKGDALDKLREIGISPVLINFQKSFFNLISFITAYYKIKKFCVEKNINIIHSHHRYPELLAYLISRTVNIKTVSTVQSIVFGKNILSFRSDRIIAISEIVKQNLINNFRVNEKNITKLYYFINPLKSYPDSELHEFKKSRNIQLSERIILFAGRINLIKGADVLIKVITNQILPKYLDVKFLLVGSFELDNEYWQIIQNNSKIIFIPSTSLVSFFYQLSDLVVLPSRVEPFGLVMAEAGLFKKPFIGGNTGGIAEFIDDRKNGLLVEPGSVESLTTAIEWVLDHPEEAGQLGENLHQKVLTLNSKEEYIEKLIGIYSELLSSE